VTTNKMTQQSGFETFEHGADIGIRGWGPSLEEAFAQGARAMFSLMCDDIGQVTPGGSVELELSSSELDLLFLVWLNRLLAESDLEGILFCEFKVQFPARGELQATSSGESFARLGCERGVEVKGATFTELKVFEQDGIWTAQCVVDV